MIENVIFSIDQFSFWVGFVGGILFAWLLSQARKAIPGFFRMVGRQIAAARESMTTGLENRIRQDVLNWAQQQHLSASLFSLNEIVILPRLMNPPKYTQLEDELELDITSKTIPYMPDWPELAAHYGAVTMTLPQALENSANIVIIGQPGSGKTVALAHLASQIALREPELGDLTDLFPMFIPAPALLGHIDVKEPIDAAIQTMSRCYVSGVAQSRLKNLLKYLLQSGRVLLLLDGLDELVSSDIDNIKDYIFNLQHEFPKLRMVLTASIADFGKLQKLNLAPLAIAGWSTKDKTRYIEQWQTNWNDFISGDEINNETFVDSLLLVRWLSQKEVVNAPFDITLKTWGSFAGDTLGPSTPALIYAHLRRLTAAFSNAMPALETLALAMVDSQTPIIEQRDAVRIISDHFRSMRDFREEEETGEVESDNDPSEAKSELKDGSPSQLVSSFLENGILASYGSGVLTFTHPFFLGYLAGRAMSGTDIAEQDSQPEWLGRTLTLGFLGIFDDITPIIEDMLDAGQQSPTHWESFQAARLMQFTTKDISWRPTILRNMLGVLQNDYETLQLAGRALSALLIADDPGIPNVLRQLAKSNQPTIRQLAALGLGIIGDDKAAETLNTLLDDVIPGVMQAANLGLVALGTKNALDSVVWVLLNHNEAARRAAAEAIVNHSQEGPEILKEGITMDDLLVRRAVIYGMVRARNPEFKAILEQVAIEDAQWVVRNAASQALDIFKTSHLNVPHQEQNLINQPWLLEYAAKSGIGVGDIKQAEELVRQALEHGEYKERLNSLAYLRQHLSSKDVPILYHAYYGSQDDLREACFDVLWHATSGSIEMPSPVQFGLG